MKTDLVTSRRVLVTGGAGYVGARLIPTLLTEGYHVTVLDTFWYGTAALAPVVNDPRLTCARGDIRSPSDVASALVGCTDVIHLACISNDPSYDLDPDLGHQVNYEAFGPLVQASKNAGVTRFLYASSSSVYGVKEEEQVTENLALTPLTDYSRYKALCEDILLAATSPDFTGVVLRPATVCGYSPRQRLDLTVNILTNHAVNRGRIRVFGGSQFRPNIHIDDMCRAYRVLLSEAHERVQGQVFNIGTDNLTVDAIAALVQEATGGDTPIVHEPTDDLRSYRISSDHIRRTIGFAPELGVREAVRDLVDAFGRGDLPDSFEDSRYFNIARMREVLAGDAGPAAS